MAPRKKSTKKSVAKVLDLTKEVEFRDGSVLTVREITLEQLVTLVHQSNEIEELFSALSAEESLNYKNLVANPALLILLKKLASACSDKNPSFFENRPLSDWLKVITAVKDVHDMEELTSLFLGLIQGANALMETRSDESGTSENQY